MENTFSKRGIRSSTPSKSKITSSPFNQSRDRANKVFPEAAFPVKTGEVKEVEAMTSTVKPNVVKLGTGLRVSVVTKLESALHDVGYEIAAREAGEDASYLLGALFALPFAQEYWTYCNDPGAINAAGSISTPTTSDVLVCLWGIALVVEHCLSIIGIMAIERQGVRVTHKKLTLSVPLIFGTAWFCLLLAGAAS